MVSDSLIQITLVYSPQSRITREIMMDVLAGTTVHQALLQSKLQDDFPNLTVRPDHVGVWGRKVDQSHVLRDQDRIEIYRDLTVDPKVARRERFTRQGAKAAGLFSKKREGAKAGY